MSDAELAPLADTLPTEAEAPPPMIETAGGSIPRARGAAAKSLTHGGITARQFLSIHLTGAGFLIIAGALFYGWRALITLAIVEASAIAAIAAWQRIGARGQQLNYRHGAWMALLLGLTLPPQLMSDTCVVGDVRIVAWPILPAAAILLVIILWTFGGVGSGRIHPVVLAHLVVMAIAGQLLIPHTVLQRTSAVIGDVLRAGDPKELQRSAGPWQTAAIVPGQDAVRCEPPSQILTAYTSGIERPEGSFLSLEALLRDRLPPLEDLLMGGVPGPIGTSSAIAVIIGGMFLLYRGVIDYRIPLLICVAALLALLVLPVPVEIKDTTRQWHWLAMRHRDVTPAVAVTFVNYELMASPLLFVAFFLATEPTIRPMARRARALYALLIGILAAVLQLYFSVRAGPYLALLIAGPFAPLIDRWFVPRTLV